MHTTLILLALAAALGGLSSTEYQAALRGQTITRTEPFARPDGKAAGRGLGAAVIDRPISKVWATLARFEDKAEYMPRVEAVAVLARAPGRLRVRMDINATVTRARYTAWFQLDEAARTIRWKLDPAASDNSIADTEGGYDLFEIAPARTLLVYRTYVDTGRRLPQFIQDYMTRRSLPALLRAIKARVER